MSGQVELSITQILEKLKGMILLGLEEIYLSVPGVEELQAFVGAANISLYYNDTTEMSFECFDDATPMTVDRMSRLFRDAMAIYLENSAKYKKIDPDYASANLDITKTLLTFGCDYPSYQVLTATDVVLDDGVVIIKALPRIPYTGKKLYMGGA